MAQLFEPGVGWEDVSSSTLPATGVTAGSYGDSSHVGAFTVGADGRITAASNVGVSGGGGTTEYDYVQSTSLLTLTGSEQSWIDGNAVTYDGATRVKIEVSGFLATNGGTATTAGVIVRLYDGTTEVGRIADVRCGTSSATFTQVAMVYGATFLTPSAASHTYHLTVRFTATPPSSTGTIGGGSGTGDGNLPAWYRITGA